MLSLLGNCLDAAGAMHLVSGNWPLLTELDLMDNALDEMAVRCLADNNWPLLKTLDLTVNEELDISMLALMNPQQQAITHIDPSSHKYVPYMF